MGDVIRFRDDLELLRLAAREVCLPCRQNADLVDQGVHEVAPNGVRVFCLAAPINRLMQMRMLVGVPEAWWLSSSPGGVA